MESKKSTEPTLRWWNRFGPWWTKLLGLVGVSAMALGGVSAGWDVFDRVTPAAEAGANTSPTPLKPNDVGGWGPSRQVFKTGEDPAYAVLNSQVDHPKYGDERNFVGVANARGGPYTDLVRADIGDDLYVRVIVHNNCRDGVDPSRSTIHGLQMRFVAARETTDIPVRVVIEADNAFTVWDSASIITSAPASVIFLSGSITFKTNHSLDAPFLVPDGDFGKGKTVVLGQSALDGELPIGADSNGIDQGAGIVLFKLRVVKGEG